ncbi:molecular chaperone HtpG [Helicovermis profundi]|uniref:Molecular chaperone HtpG n=1 Tax=Helicovermis profundi TaxID=3065157 RepID=A0AAU9EP25_9FIRM|nr:molecular chaperone HtpG [Clostridia bacterium S502]
MSKEKGSLSIHSENIFPIIKKWLYSDHDIFVRELVSNACDAITKLTRLNSLGEISLEDNEFSVKIILDKENKTIKIIDNGIGMTAEEIKKYINQIAFSGAEDFLEKYKDKGDKEQIIGHFGLGFYSAFMVAERVQINTKSYVENSESALWTCEGGTEFEIADGTKESRGTEITLFVSDEGKSFLDEYTLRSTIEKYCSFMPFPIYLEVVGKEPNKDEDGNVIIEDPKAINVTQPLYVKKPNECTDEEYKEFYKDTFKDFKEPLFWIHLNMDYPFNLKGILYFPKLNTEFDTLEGQIKLYNNQVFVANNIKEVIPEFLLLLKGVIDCPDLPLNVSRSFLQNDGFVKKISDYISKKVSDKLSGMFKTDRLSYEKFFDDISPFIKYGSLKDEKFAKKVEEIMLYKNKSGNFVTISEYLDLHAGKLENKVYYTTDIVQQAHYIELLKEHGIDVLILNHSIDPPFVSLLESKNDKVKFIRVDADLSDVLTDAQIESDTEETIKITEELSNVFKSALNKEEMKLKVESFKSNEVSAMIVLSEENRRMQDMLKMYGNSGIDPNMFPSNEELVLNKNNKLVDFLINSNYEENKELMDTVAMQVYDLALIGHKKLSPEKMVEFLKRSNKILNMII